MKLTTDQINIIKSEMVANGVPVRFQIDGRTLDITSGTLQSKGINVIHQQVYWRFTKETSKKIAEWTGSKAVFSE